MKTIVFLTRNFILLLSMMLVTLPKHGMPGKKRRELDRAEYPGSRLSPTTEKTIRFPSETAGLQQIQNDGSQRRNSVSLCDCAGTGGRHHCRPAATSSRNIMLFESPDITTLYSQYRQSSSNVELTSKNLIHVKEMYNNQGATARDLNSGGNRRRKCPRLDGRNGREAESVWFQSCRT